MDFVFEVLVENIKSMRLLVVGCNRGMYRVFRDFSLGISFVWREWEGILIGSN